MLVWGFRTALEFVGAIGIGVAGFYLGRGSARLERSKAQRQAELNAQSAADFNAALRKARFRRT